MDIWRPHLQGMQNHWELHRQRTENSHGEITEADVAFATELKHARHQEGSEHGHSAAGYKCYKATPPSQQRDSKGKPQRGHGCHSCCHVVANVIPLACEHTSTG